MGLPFFILFNINKIPFVSTIETEQMDLIKKDPSEFEVQNQVI